VVIKDDDYGDVARWLRDAAARRVGKAAQSRSEIPVIRTESAETVLLHFEQLTGRTFGSRDTVHAYLKELAADEDVRTRAATNRRIYRETLLLGLLLAAFLHYYYWDVNLQIASLAHLQVYVPVTEHHDQDRGRINRHAT
jgi:hypothetical protein